MTKQRSIMPHALWTVQIVLALLFLFAGAMKLVMPIEAMTKEMPLPGLFLRFVGVAEVLGGGGPDPSRDAEDPHWSYAAGRGRAGGDHDRRYGDDPFGGTGAGWNARGVRDLGPDGSGEIQLPRFAKERTVQLVSYLTFNGDCEAAFKFYAQTLGAKIEAMLPHAGTPAEAHTPPEWRDKILHARLSVGTPC